MTHLPWIVHKFGGTSVLGAERIRNVAKILREEPSPRKAVVVSAMKGTTDALIDLVELARKRDDSYLTKLEALKAKHLEELAKLPPTDAQRPLVEVLDADFKDIQEVLRGVWQVRASSDRTVELISGYGELWSSRFLNAYLISQGVKSAWLDARQVLFVDPQETSVFVDWELSRPKLDAWLGANPSDWVIITGYIASTRDGIPTTLRRNGSDYSASIFGALLDASEILIWTDVDGVLSADPRLVPEAVVLEQLSYNEASELAYFGAKVVHPSTMAPAIEKKIPIWIKNTFNPKFRGTKIHEHSAKLSEAGHVVAGFATIDQVALVNVEGTGMVGVPGVAQRLFGALKEVGVSVILISQASSEHSICFAIPQAQAGLAKQTVERAFFAELHHGQIETVTVTDGCSILAAVGDNMVERPGIAGKFFTALGEARVNIRAIAQGSSERNISAVIDGADSKRALRASHAAFYLSNQTLSVGVIGPGLIGGTLLDQLRDQLGELRERFKIDLRVRGILSSKHMLLSDAPIDLSSWKAQLEASQKGGPDLFARHIQTDYLPHSVIIDCTGGSEVPEHYPEWLERGIHIITPNKKANTGTMDFYRRLKRLSQARHRHYLYETTVGAGLPVINTLRDLVQTGDRVHQIEGILSGTLSYIFNSFVPGKKFSEIVKAAREQGYTEPDPRDDLSGMDVARKLVILAREMGLELEVSDIAVESLVPEKLRQGSVDEFMAALPAHDAEMAKLIESARARGETLRYVGCIDLVSGREGKASVALRPYPAAHAFARLTGSDNIVAFTTERYLKQPLIVQGPGAGPHVTAAGVFADLLRLTSYVGGA